MARKHFKRTPVLITEEVLAQAKNKKGECTQEYFVIKAADELKDNFTIEEWGKKCLELGMPTRQHTDIVINWYRKEKYLIKKLGLIEEVPSVNHAEKLSKEALAAKDNDTKQQSKDKAKKLKEKVAAE